MSEEIYEYKCPNCAAPLRFDAPTGKLVCDWCDSKFEVDVIREMEEAAAAAEAAAQKEDGTAEEIPEYHGEEWEGVVLNLCPSCGAEIVTDETTSATKCPYCGNFTFIRKNIEGALRPDLVIPFKLDAAGAKEALAGFSKKKPLLPRNFLREIEAEETQGLYVPFWLYTCDTEGEICYNATRVSTWSDARYRYTKTDHYFVKRDGRMTFERIPSDGSKKMDDTVMEAMEPYDYEELVPFNSGYLSGFAADKYDVSSCENIRRIHERAMATVRTEFQKTVQGYATVSRKSENVRIAESSIRYALFPVWVLDYRYHDKRYVYTVNGQTGKVAGQLPLSWGKFFAWFFGLFAGVSAILWLILALIGGVL